MDEKSSMQTAVSDEELLEFASAPSNEGLAQLRELGEEYVRKVRELEKLSEAASVLSQAIFDLESRRLPDAMAQLGIDSLGLPEVGADLEAKNYYKAAIPADWPDEQRQEAFQYLRSLGAGGLIRTEVLAAFGVGQDEEAIRVAELLHEQGISTETKQNVPWATLTSFVRERVETGLPLEPKKLNATVGRVVKIKARKGEKKAKKSNG
jgi:hypothetical protein